MIPAVFANQIASNENVIIALKVFVQTIYNPKF